LTCEISGRNAEKTLKIAKDFFKLSPSLFSPENTGTPGTPSLIDKKTLTTTAIQFVKLG